MKAGLIDDQGDQQGNAEEQQTGGEGGKALDEQVAETAEVRVDEVVEMRGNADHQAYEQPDIEKIQVPVGNLCRKDEMQDAVDAKRK